MRRLLLAAGAFAFTALHAAPVLLTHEVPTYTQDFETLPTASAAAWLDDSTLPGWYASATAFAKSINAGGLHLYSNSQNGNTLGLGILGITATGHSISLLLTNPTQEAITNLTINHLLYVGYIPDSHRQTQLTCSYAIGNAADLLADNATSHPIPALSQTYLAGFDAAQFSNQLHTTLPVNLLPNNSLLLKWSVPAGASQYGVAIDNLAITAQFGQPQDIPETPDTPDAITPIPLTRRGYAQNFNVTTIQAALTLPAGWRIDSTNTARTLGTYTAALTNGLKSISAGDTPTTGLSRYEGSYFDYAIGALSSGTACKTANIYLCASNSTHQHINHITLDYSIEKYRCGTNPDGYSIRLYTSPDGQTWTEHPDAITSFLPDPTNDKTDTPPIATQRKQHTLPVNLPPDAHLYLAWSYSVTTGSTTSNAQALALDNVTLTPILTARPVIIRIR